ncbi:hypothetical protein [Streptomyces sp. NBC_01518]|uniref:hypothetical protein n=1 Tax=Streptomyces sp. NBC_01518 TaxID=2903891 RepID=UPI00386D1769
MSVEADWVRVRVDPRGICDFIGQGVRQVASDDVQFQIRVGRDGLDGTAALFTGGTDVDVVAQTVALCLLRRFGDLQGLRRADLGDERACVIARMLTRGCSSAEVEAAVQTPLPLHPGAARVHADVVTDALLGSR